MLQSHADILNEIEKIKREQKNQSETIQAILRVINSLISPDPAPKKEPIGFRAK